MNHSFFKKMIRLAVFLAVCQPLHGKDRFYGEYPDPVEGATKCAFSLAQLLPPKGRRTETVVMGALLAAISLTIGLAVTSYTPKRTRFLIMNKVSEVKKIPLPVTQEPLRRETANKVADSLLWKLSLEGRSDSENKLENVLWFLKKHAWLWHHGGGEELAKSVPRKRIWWWQDSGNNYHLLRELLREAVYEELASDDTSWRSATGLDLPELGDLWRSVTFDKGAFRTRKEFQRICALPVQPKFDPTGYINLLGGLLLGIDLKAYENDQRLGSDVVNNFFGSKEAARYREFTETRSQSIVTLQKIESALANADVGSTVGQALEKAGLKFYIDQINPLLEFRPSPERKGP
jgi:hypothetical protein